MARTTAFIVGLTLLAASCGGGDGGGASLLYGTAAGIVERDLHTGEVEVLVPPPAPTHTMRDPSVSPDGTRIAFVDAPPLTRVGGVLDASSDVWIANRDGSEARMVYERQALAESASLPVWVDDAAIIFVLRTIIDPASPTGGAHYRVARLDIESGVVTAIAEGAFQLAISPDRTTIAYLVAESADEQPLFIAATDGDEPARRLLDTAGSGLEGFAAVAFTYDGTAVLLAAHEQGEANRAAGKFAALHTAPLDLYLVPLDGSAHSMAAPAQIDGPGLTFGADDRAFALAGKLLEIDLEEGAVTELDNPAQYGGLTYVDD